MPVHHVLLSAGGYSLSDLDTLLNKIKNAGGLQGPPGVLGSVIASSHILQRSEAVNYQYYNYLIEAFSELIT